MKIHVYQRSKSFFDLCPRSLRMILDLRWAKQVQLSSGLNLMTQILVVQASIKGSDQTGCMPRLIWVFAGHTLSYCYTLPHKSGKVLCFTLRTLTVRRPSISASFPCSNFSTFWPIFFKLCIDIGIGEEWYGIVSGLISFWNNRVMALDVCQKCFALCFRALTLVPF